MNADDVMAFLALVVAWSAALAGGGFVFRALWRRFIGPAD
jgi:hypothetical protein